MRIKNYFKFKDPNKWQHVLTILITTLSFPVSFTISARACSARSRSLQAKSTREPRFANSKAALKPIPATHSNRLLTLLCRSFAWFTCICTGNYHGFSHQAHIVHALFPAVHKIDFQEEKAAKQAE